MYTTSKDSPYNIFSNPTKGRLSFEEVIKEIVLFVEDNPDDSYQLIIGTDSKAQGNNGQAKIEFVSAVVIHRKGHWGRYFWIKEKQDKNLFLRDRIYMEVFKSISLAQKLMPKLEKLLSKEQYDLEIHIDVGPNGETKKMIREVVGMVVGNGYRAKTKPDSYGASAVADKHT